MLICGNARERYYRVGYDDVGIWERSCVVGVECWLDYLGR